MFGEAAGGGKGGIIIAIPKSTHTKTELLSSSEIAVQLRVFGPLRKLSKRAGKGTIPLSLSPQNRKQETGSFGSSYYSDVSFLLFWPSARTLEEGEGLFSFHQNWLCGPLSIACA